MSRQGVGRWTAERLVLLAVVGIVLRTWGIAGLLVPFQVASGSMADTLVGPHREVLCADCGYRFALAADLGAVPSRATCPNCGFDGNGLADRPEIAGDRVLVDRLVYNVRPPRRWELAAIRDPRRPSRLLVKRVVGLPGESIQIRDGEVYVNGQLQRKPLFWQRAVAVPVYDANHAPQTPRAPRWDFDPTEHGWKAAGGHYTHPSVPGATSVDWLTYRHWRRIPGRPDEVREEPILNFRAYNQASGQRAENIHAVADVMLSFRLVRAFGEGQLLLKATGGGEEFQVAIQPDTKRLCGNFCAKHGSGRAGRTFVAPFSGGLDVEVSLFDRQFLLALDGRPVVVFPYEHSSPRGKPSSRPLAIGSRGLGVELCDLRVYRDVYYTRPVGTEGRWGLDEPALLGADEYFVLGDNSPVSYDSRTWPDAPGVPARLVFGRPFLVHFPARQLPLGPWHFQVPDLGKIRYIR